MPHTRMVTTSEMIAALEGNKLFCAGWDVAISSVLMSFFTTVQSHKVHSGLEIQFGYQFNSQSYSIEEVTGSRIHSLIALHSTPILKALNGQAHGRVMNDIYDHFMAKLVHAATSGEAKLSDEVSHALSVIYASDPVNVAQSCRDLGLSRYAVLKLIEVHNKDSFYRYTKVQSGQAYAKVMGDCAPYIHNYPQFSPIVLFEQYTNPSKYPLVEAGALVAQLGSSVWHEVSELFCPYSSGSSVYTTTTTSIRPPFRLLPAQYREVAERFCSQIAQPTECQRERRLAYTKELSEAMAKSRRPTPLQ